MEQSRLDMLERYYKEDPEDPFIIYALALEYEHIDVDKAEMMYNLLAQNHPDYLPAYYKAAHFFMDRQDLARAKSLFETGIRLAGGQGDIKTLSELKAAYQILIIDLEDE